MDTEAVRTTACCHAADGFVSAAATVSSTRSAEERYQRLFEALFSVLPCEAAVMLTLTPDGLVPVAVTGFDRELLGRRFGLSAHPGLREVLTAPAPVVLDARSPFANLLEGSTPRPDALLGCALRSDEETVGALIVSLGARASGRDVETRELLVFASLAAANLRMVALVDSLDALAQKRGMVSRDLVADAHRRGGGELIGRSASMQRLREEIATVADADLIVLVTGETGTGKELVARSLHAQSSRAAEPLIYVNCAALPESIAESELFGHVKGAFTGAESGRVGKFELADGGTLFLDEIGELPLTVQPKLLRAIQSGEIQRLGADQNAHVNARIIAATNRNLEKEVALGRFRIDLFHRISVYPIEVPPLRERLDDVGLLAGHFLDSAQARLGLGPARLTAAALEQLLCYDWPGNVRELDHVITRGLLRAARGRVDAVTVEAAHLGLLTPGSGRLEAAPEPRPAGPAPAAMSLRESIMQHKRQVIAAAVTRTGGNWAEAARQLKLHRSNLYRTAKQVGLKVSDDTL